MILTTTILASQILALHQDAEFPQQRQVLPNGAVTFVEAGEPNGIFSAAIHFGNANVSAQNRAAGAPHLWEHIAAKGPNKSLDMQLESAGFILRASTDRDGTTMSIVGPKKSWQIGVSALLTLLNPISTSQAEIDTESKILKQESLLLAKSWGMESAAWAAMFGPQDADPFGQLDVMAKFTPEQIELIHQQMTNPEAISVAITGDIPVNVVNAMLGGTLGKIGKLPSVTPSRKSVQTPSTVRGKGRGLMWAIPVTSLASTKTLSSIGLGFAFSTEYAVNVNYQPSALPGFVMLGSEDPGVMDKLFQLEPEKFAPFVGRAQLAARAYVRGLRSNQRTYTELNARMIRMNRAWDFDQLVAIANQVSASDVLEAYQSMNGEEMMIVEGGLN